MKTILFMLTFIVACNLYGRKINHPLQDLIHDADIILMGEIQSVPPATKDILPKKRISVAASPVKVEFILKGELEEAKNNFEFQSDIYYPDTILKPKKKYIIFAKYDPEKKLYRATYFTPVKDQYMVCLLIYPSMDVIKEKGNRRALGTFVIFFHRWFLTTIVSLVSYEDDNYNVAEKRAWIKKHVPQPKIK